MAKTRARRRSAPGITELPGLWVRRHLQSAIATLGRLMQTPLPTFMTLAVIAVALAFPAGLYVLTVNLRTLAGGWDQAAAVSLFLQPEVTQDQAEKLATELRAWPELARVQVISSEQALAEFRDQSGFQAALIHLKNNPLPAVLALFPQSEFSTPQRVEVLQERLMQLPGADFARMDTQWLVRFQAILDLAQTGVLLLAVLLGMGVLLIVGNTIRLEILNRRSEIEIMELVGATAAFIRRPFLYAGAWYGLLGGIGAWILVTIGLALLQGPASHLASLYQSDFRLAGLGPAALGSIFGGSMLLGLVGSWIAVGRHLRGAEPG